MLRWILLTWPRLEDWWARYVEKEGGYGDPAGGR